MLSFLDRERTIAPRGYNRWLIPPAALAVHLSIGEVYAFSVFKTPLVDHFDTKLTPIEIIFSIAIGMLGLAAAFGGRWVERAGPRKAMALAAACWASGFVIGALGVATEQLWLVYLGYGVLGGIGLGIGYISPVSTLIKWFPDRPGMATGLAIMGFGGGALIASPLTNKLLSTYADQPQDAIVAAIYFVAMMAGSFTVRVPADGWKPEGWTPPEKDHRRLVTNGNVTATNAIKTPQFWMLWTVLFCNVTAGIGILEQAAPMIQDFFSSVSAAAAAGFVGVLSLCNMSGRFGWSSTSDVIGRKRTYMMYLGVGAALYFLLATIEVGAIHGRLLTAWSAAGIAGPLIVNGLADIQEANGQEGAGLYKLSLFIMVGILVVGFVANLMIKPVDERFHEPERRVEGERAAGAERFTRDGEPATASPTATTTTRSES